MSERIRSGGLSIDPSLYNLVRNEIAPGTGVRPDAFWSALASIVRDLEPANRKLLEKRDMLQKRIDAFHLSHKWTHEGGLPSLYIGEFGSHSDITPRARRTR